MNILMYRLSLPVYSNKLTIIIYSHRIPKGAQYLICDRFAFATYAVSVQESQSMVAKSVLQLHTCCVLQLQNRFCKCKTSFAGYTTGFLCKNVQNMFYTCKTCFTLVIQVLLFIVQLTCHIRSHSHTYHKHNAYFNHKLAEGTTMCAR